MVHCVHERRSPCMFGGVQLLCVISATQGALHKIIKHNIYNNLKRMVALFHCISLRKFDLNRVEQIYTIKIKLHKRQTK